MSPEREPDDSWTVGDWETVSHRSHRDSVPTGIEVIVVVDGAITGFAVLLLAVGLLGASSLSGALTALVWLGLGVAWLFVLRGLYRLESWAWGWFLVLESVKILWDVLTEDAWGILLALVSVLFVVYVYSRRDAFREQSSGEGVTTRR